MNLKFVYLPLGIQPFVLCIWGDPRNTMMKPSPTQCLAAGDENATLSACSEHRSQQGRHLLR